MTDWTAATPTLANGEYPTSYLPVRVPGAADLFKQVPIARFVTTDGSGNANISGGGLVIQGVPASIPAQVGGVFFATYEYPRTRLYFGDGSGYSIAFSKRIGSVTTDLVTVTDSGNLLVGQTASGVQNANSIAIEGPGNGRILFNHLNGSVNGSYYAYFSYNGTGIGSISQNGTTGVAFNTTSDVRVKTNIRPAGEAGSLIDRIRVRAFDWRRKGNDPVAFGLIAQELFEVMPLAVKRGDDGAVDADGNIPEDGEIWGIDPSKLVPLLIREIQSMRARLALLEGR